MTGGDEHYAFVAFLYIHQNPVKSKLVEKPEEWPYSSFVDFSGSRNGTLCDKLLAEKLIGYDKHNFIVESGKTVNDDLAERIFNINGHYKSV